MRMVLLLAVLGISLGWTPIIHAETPVGLGGPWLEIAIVGDGLPALACGPASCQQSSGANSAFAGSPPWTFTAPAAGAYLSVTGAFARGTWFSVFDFGSPIGITPNLGSGGYCRSDSSMFFASNPDLCFADTSVSHGVFRLPPGPHSITFIAHNPPGATAAYFRIDPVTTLVVGTNGLRLMPVQPCRAIDTRVSAGLTWPYGPPSLLAGNIRGFPIRSQVCNIPPTARAYAMNITVVPHGPLGFLTVWPSTAPMPLASTLNSPKGEIVANAAVIPAGDDGAIYFYASNETDLIVDINGYFDSNNAASSLYRMDPCRAVDTRFSGPMLTAGETRTFPLPFGPCLMPPVIAAYALNVTAVPAQPLGYLTLWPAANPMPLASTLNSPSGLVKANMALIPGGPTGAISAFTSNPSDIVLDVNGYFAAPGLPGALSFYPLTPCRIADTRFPDNAILSRSYRTFSISDAVQCQVPPNATAYMMNVTAVPDGALAYLTIWAADKPQPFVSTLNSPDGSIIANAAIVPAGAGGRVNVYATDRTHVVLDISGYFAPAASLDPLAVPAPLSPPNGATFSYFPRNLTLSWLPVPGATLYGVEIQYCSGQNCTWLRTDTTPSTQFTFAFIGAQGGRWRIWAIDEITGRVSFISNWTMFSFTI